MNIPGYPKSRAYGHREIISIMSSICNIEEKIDGSQFSAMNSGGELLMRSKGAEIYPDSPPDLFAKTAETLIELHQEGGLPDGLIIRGEAMKGPKHNALCYERAPDGHFVLFDIDDGLGNYWSWDRKKAWADDMGLECVPLIDRETKISGVFQLNEYLEKTTSILGGPIEGIVIKPVEPIFGRDGKALMAKHVSASFKEKNQKNWSGGKKKDIFMELTETLRTEARWDKAIMRLAEMGELEHSPRDIGKLIKSIQSDILEEEGDWIAQQLLKSFRLQIIGGATAGFPEYYKSKLLEAAFGDVEAA